MDTRRHSGFVLQFGVDIPSTPKTPQTQTTKWQATPKNVSTLEELDQVQQRFEQLARKQNAWLTHKPNKSSVSSMTNYPSSSALFNLTPPPSDTSSTCDEAELESAFQSCSDAPIQRQPHQSHSPKAPKTRVLMFQPKQIETSGRLMQVERSIQTFDEACQNFTQSLVILMEFAWKELSTYEILFIILDSSFLLGCLWYFS